VELTFLFDFINWCIKEKSFFIYNFWENMFLDHFSVIHLYS
jgi:hypothetical protein